MRADVLSAETNHLSRAFRLIWGRLGRARAYVAAAAIAVVALAGVGFWHLISPLKQTQSAAADRSLVNATPVPKPPPSSSPQTAIARIQPGAERSLSPATPTPAPAPAEAEGKVQITKIEQTEKRGPHGETFVVATIGLASQADVENTGGVEIHVYFYDLTPDNEIRPTDAQVTYQWLTPVRDWSDPAPKFLAATYFKRSRGPRSFERLRYGGFVVRVFSGGKLQDEQSHPGTLLALFQTNAPPTSRRSLGEGGSPSAILNPPSSPPSRPSQSSQPSTLNSQHSEQPLPNGIPISGKPGFVQSPYDPKFIIDVRGFPPGTLVSDPNTNRPFRVP